MRYDANTQAMVYKAKSDRGIYGGKLNERHT